MIWIPVVFLCLSNGSCGFIQGNPTYTERGCDEQLRQILPAVQADANITAFDATCVYATPI